MVRLFKGEVSFNLVLDKKKVDKLVKKIRFLDLRNKTLRGIRKRGVEYTYGSRALNHRIAGNQIQEMVDKLSKKPYSRRAIAILWDHEKDKKSPFPPCLIVIQGIISNDKYYHTVFIRSNDMDKGWPINAYAQVKLAEYIVNEINKKSKTDYRVGGITTISCSAHLYRHSWERVKKILKENKSALESFVPDERGNVFISASKDGIELQHRTQDNRLLRRFSGSVEKVYSAAKSLGLIPEHMLYLGRILGRFEKNF